MARYAIGDVQGCMNELQALLEKIHFDPSQDQLWFVGDLVNRGPASLAVLRFVRSLGPHAVTVLGNHDLHLLSVAEGVAASRADDTVQDILNAHDRAELLDWLRQQPLIHRAADWTMVHAGLLPSWSIAQATALAHEIEVQLRGPDYRALLSSMYGSEPNVWQDSLIGAPRHRVIVNAFTRMRLCSMDGRMQLQFKGTPQQAPIDYLPWFDVPLHYPRDTRVVCGHWSALGLHLTPTVCAIDTGCVWGGALSALRLEDAMVFQVPSPGYAVAHE